VIVDWKQKWKQRQIVRTLPGLSRSGLDAPELVMQAVF